MLPDGKLAFTIVAFYFKSNQQFAQKSVDQVNLTELKAPLWII
jgi:hypothetical protein